MDPLSAIGWSAGGGLAISILDYAALHRVPKRQRRASFADPAYLLKFFGHPLIGGFVGWAAIVTDPTYAPLTMIAFGAGAPSLLRAFVRSLLAGAHSIVREFPGHGSDPPNVDPGV